MQVEIPGDDAAAFATTIASDAYQLEERGYKDAVGVVIRAIFDGSRRDELAGHLSAFFAGTLSLTDVGLSHGQIDQVETAVEPFRGVRNAFSNLCGGRWWGVNNFVWIPGAVDDGLGPQITDAFSSLVDEGGPLAARVDQFRAALREVEVAGTDRASWQPQWNVINIQLQFVGALLGAYDPSKYTFYHSGQLQKAFQDYHQEWPSAGGGTRYAAACEFVRGVYDALHAHGVEVRDLI